MQLIPQVREALLLLEKKKARGNRIVVEGEHLVEEAGERIEYLLYASELPVVRRAIAGKVPAYKISRKMFERLTSVETPQGVLAVVKKPEHSLDEIAGGTKPLIVFCVCVQDPGNLGTIIRSADAVRAAGVLVSKGTVDLYNQKVIRSTMGSLFHIPVAEVGDGAAAIAELKKKKIRIVASDISGKKDYWQADLSGAVAILVGNEGAGLSDELLAECDEVVRIPMPGRAESLNAAMALTLIMYEALRQRTVGK